jgi:hypothetical protein
MKRHQTEPALSRRIADGALRLGSTRSSSCYPRQRRRIDLVITGIMPIHQ